MLSVASINCYFFLIHICFMLRNGVDIKLYLQLQFNYKPRTRLIKFAGWSNCCRCKCRTVRRDRRQLVDVSPGQHTHSFGSTLLLSTLWSGSARLGPVPALIPVSIPVLTYWTGRPAESSNSFAKRIQKCWWDYYMFNCRWNLYMPLYFSLPPHSLSLCVQVFIFFNIVDCFVFCLKH